MNIIYIHTHDSGRILSPYGYSIPTPNLMKFCQEALLFRQAFSVAPTCSPSRAGLLTGMYPHSNGMLGLAQRGFGLNDYSNHLVSYLKSHHYHTVLCGIQHESGSYLSQEGSQMIGYHENITEDAGRYKEEELYQWDLENADRVVQWIKTSSSDTPFFLSYGLFCTHREYPIQIDLDIEPNYILPPYPTPDCDITRKDFARFQTSAKYFDRAFGSVIKALKEKGIYDNTIIIVTTDHGISVPYSKSFLYDSGIGVALMMRVPHKKIGITDSLVSQIDIFPTLCDLLNLPKPEYLQGISFNELFDNPCADTREEIFAEFNFHTSYEPMRTIRTKRHKYIRCYDTEYLKINPSNTDNSYIKDIYLQNNYSSRPKDTEEFYDLLYDPGERCNLINNSEYEEIVNKLKKKLYDYQITTNDYIINGQLLSIQPKWKVNTVHCINPSSKEPTDYISMGE